MAVTNQYPYLELATDDNTGISIEHWQDSWSVDMHRHNYCELMLIDKGSCRHIYNGVDTLLIPGDVVIIGSHKEHGYALSGEISLYNCQFLPEWLDANVIRNIAKVGLLDAPSDPEENEATLTGSIISIRENMHASSLPSFAVNNSKQGVLHLAPPEKNYFISLIEHILSEQQREHPSPMLKQKYMEIILLEMKKIVRRQHQAGETFSKENQQIIAEVLVSIESDLTAPFDIQKTAEAYSFSPNYFRKLFKDVTGLAPIQYVNRLKITHACELIIKQGFPVRDAAEAVGIYDLNYFSRLFKKIIGCSPSKI